MHGSGSMRWLVLGWGSMRCWLCYMNIYMCVCVCHFPSFSHFFLSSTSFFSILKQKGEDQQWSSPFPSQSSPQKSIINPQINPITSYTQSPSFLISLHQTPPIQAQIPSQQEWPTRTEPAIPFKRVEASMEFPIHIPPMSLRFRHKVINHILTLSCY